MIIRKKKNKSHAFLCSTAAAVWYKHKSESKGGLNPAIVASPSRGKYSNRRPFPLILTPHPPPQLETNPHYLFQSQMTTISAFNASPLTWTAKILAHYFIRLLPSNILLRFSGAVCYLQTRQDNTFYAFTASGGGDQQSASNYPPCLDVTAADTLHSTHPSVDGPAVSRLPPLEEGEKASPASICTHSHISKMGPTCSAVIT